MANDSSPLANPQSHAPRPHPLRIFLGVLVLTVVLLWMLTAGGDFSAYISLPAAIFIVLTLLGTLMMTFGPITLLKAMGNALGISRERDAHRLAWDEAVLSFASRMSWGAGVVGTLILTIAATRNFEWSQAAYVFATVATPPLLYGSVLAVFVFTPLRQLARLRAAANHQTSASVNDNE